MTSAATILPKFLIVFSKLPSHEALVNKANVRLEHGLARVCKMQR